VSLILLICGCASPVSVERKDHLTIGDDNKKAPPIFRSSPSDLDYLRHGILRMGNSDANLPDYVGAKEAFQSLINEHPDSGWTEPAMTLIKGINNLQSCMDKEKASRALYEKTLGEKATILQDNERLTKAGHVNNERLQAEITRLGQENDRLKKDIELLKELEIKLDKRERLLR
jgi:hypothetical protein